MFCRKTTDFLGQNIPKPKSVIRPCKDFCITFCGLSVFIRCISLVFNS